MILLNGNVLYFLQLPYPILIFHHREAVVVAVLEAVVLEEVALEAPDHHQAMVLLHPPAMVHHHLPMVPHLAAAVVSAADSEVDSVAEPHPAATEHQANHPPLMVPHHPAVSAVVSEVVPHQAHMALLASLLRPMVLHPLVDRLLSAVAALEVVFLALMELLNHHLHTVPHLVDSVENHPQAMVLLLNLPRHMVLHLAVLEVDSVVDSVVNHQALMAPHPGHPQATVLHLNHHRRTVPHQADSEDLVDLEDLVDSWANHHQATVHHPGQVPAMAPHLAHTEPHPVDLEILVSEVQALVDPASVAHHSAVDSEVENHLHLMEHHRNHRPRMVPHQVDLEALALVEASAVDLEVENHLALMVPHQSRRAHTEPHLAHMEPHQAEVNSMQVTVDTCTKSVVLRKLNKNRLTFPNAILGMFAS